MKNRTVFSLALVCLALPACADFQPLFDGQSLEDKHILIQINGETQVDWTEPDDWTPPKKTPGRSLDPGTFCFQAHDPKSTVYIKDIQVNVIDD